MTKNWSFAKITDILLKNWSQWSYLKITISTKSEMSIPFTQTNYFEQISSIKLQNASSCKLATWLNLFGWV